MTKLFRIIQLGGVKARTNDNTGGDDREINLRPYSVG